MAINPLELQTLFSQINNVSKIQASNKETELLKQEAANSEIIKKSEKNSEDVPETKMIDHDYSKINEEKEKGRNKKENKKEKKEIILNEENEEVEDKNIKNKKDEKFLGTKIDILG